MTKYKSHASLESVAFIYFYSLFRGDFLMNEQDCKILIYLKEDLNVSRVAQRLYTSQPGVAYRLKQMEEEYDIKILKKYGKHLKITEEGNLLINHAENQLKLIEKTKKDIASLKGPGTGILKIGVTNSVCNTIFPKVLRKFQDIFPTIQYYIISGMSSEIFYYLQYGEIDIAIIRGDFSWGEEKCLLSTESIGIIYTEPFEYIKLPYMPRIAFKEPHYLSRYPSNLTNTVENVISEWWQENFYNPPYILMEVNGYETCMEMVKNKLGYAIVPYLFYQNHSNVYFTPLLSIENKKLERRTWLYSRKNYPEKHIQKEFVRA